MKQLPRRLALALVAVAGIVAADFESKRWAATELRRIGPQVVVPVYVGVKYRENSGALFGALARSPEPLRTVVLVTSSSLAALALSALLVLALRGPAPGWVLPGGLAAVLGGTLGNLIGRIERGFVVDFIDVWLTPQTKWPTFNVADVAISLGMALCAVHLVRLARRKRAEEPRTATEAAG